MLKCYLGIVKSNSGSVISQGVNSKNHSSKAISQSNICWCSAGLYRN